MRHRSAAGFSLIELLIVVSIIMVLSTIAIPYFMAAEQGAREATAAAMLRTLHTEQETYYISNQQYADRFNLLTTWGQAMPGAAPRGRGAGAGAGGGAGGGRGRGRGRGAGGGGGAASSQDVLVYSNYIFRLERDSADEWECSAEPIRNRGSAKYFYIDQTGVIRYALGDSADSDSPPLP